MGDTLTGYILFSASTNEQREHREKERERKKRKEEWKKEKKKEKWQDEISIDTENEIKLLELYISTW